MHPSIEDMVVIRSRSRRFSGSGDDAREAESGVTSVSLSGTHSKTSKMY